MSVQSTGLGKRWGRISDAEEFTGFKKGFIYKLAKKHPGLLRKVGAATAVDLEMLGVILENAPAAKLSKGPATSL
jgi:hypothetical protein